MSLPLLKIDAETHKRLGKIAAALGLNERSAIHKLVSQEYARLLAEQLISSEQVNAGNLATGQNKGATS